MDKIEWFQFNHGKEDFLLENFNKESWEGPEFGVVHVYRGHEWDNLITIWYGNLKEEIEKIKATYNGPGYWIKCVSAQSEKEAKKLYDKRT